MYTKINIYTRTLYEICDKITLSRIVMTFPLLVAYNTEPNWPVKLKLYGLSSRANYTDRATAACRQSDCQRLRIEGATWSAWRIPTAVFSIF
jgi:hypothetical protein